MSTIRRIRRNLMAQYSTPAYCVCSEDHFVYKYVYDTRQLHVLFRLPHPIDSVLARTKDRILRSRLVRWYRRNIGIGDVFELPTGTLIACYDKIYRYASSNHSGIAEAVQSFQAMNFFAPLKNGVAINPDNQCAYFGEYQNTRPYAAKIMRLCDDGTRAEICYTFPKGRVKHIHSVTWDSFRKRLWIATGDNDSEVGLYYTDDDFRTVSYFNGGSQTWRMVSLLPTEQALYWGSDAGKDADAHAENCIVRWNFSKNCLEKLDAIGNPAYYSVTIAHGGMLLGTTYEPGMKQRTEQAAAIWHSRDGEQWEKIYALPYKNRQRTQGTRYATINLPAGCVPRDLIPFTPLNTEHWDFDLLAMPLGDRV